MADEIIEELWKIKDSIAHEYAYNVDALVAHLKEKGLSTGQTFVDLGAMNPTKQEEKKTTANTQPHLSRFLKSGPREGRRRHKIKRSKPEQSHIYIYQGEL